MPEPSPVLVEISTTDGRTFATTFSYAVCKSFSALCVFEPLLSGAPATGVVADDVGVAAATTPDEAPVEFRVDARCGDDDEQAPTTIAVAAATVRSPRVERKARANLTGEGLPDFLRCNRADRNDRA